MNDFLYNLVSRVGSVCYTIIAPNYNSLILMCMKFVWFPRFNWSICYTYFLQNMDIDARNISKKKVWVSINLRLLAILLMLIGIHTCLNCARCNDARKSYLLKMRLLRLFEYKRGKWSLYIKMSKYNKFGKVELCSNVPPDRFLYDALGAYAFYLPESMFHMQFAFEM